MHLLSRIFFGQEFETKSFLLFYLLCKYRFNHLSSEEIKRYQRYRLRRIVSYAFNNSDFYRSQYRKHDLSDFNSLPFVNKNIMMENLTDFNTVGLTKEEIMEFCLKTEASRDFSKRLNGFNIGMSSGTSGNKGVEIVSSEEENYMKAALFARFDFPKNEKINLAFILRVSSPAFNLNRFGHKMTYISQLSPLEKIINELNILKPNVLSAPPSMLKIIAQEVERGALRINPERVVSYAEVLYPDVKKYLENVFKCTIHQIYKCTEGPIGISCKYGKLHINEDMVYVETYDRDGTSTKPGTPSYKMVVTDLHKRSQPIIRYELNDIITISPDKCECKSNFRVIEKIQGRADDMFWGIRKDKKDKHFIYQDYIARAVISVADEITDFQAIQTDYKKVFLRIKLSSVVNKKIIEKDLIKAIRNVFAKYECQEPAVEVIYGEPLVNKNSHKLARIICKIKR